LAKTFGLDLDKDVVRRVLAKHYRCGWRKPRPSIKPLISSILWPNCCSLFFVL
jgi:hypothetical protein